MSPHSLLHGTRVRACGAFVTGGSVGPGLSALAGPTHTLTTAATQQPKAGHAGVGTSGAVAVLPLPVGGALAEPAVAGTVSWRKEEETGVRWLSGEGVGLVIRRLLVRFPGCSVLGQGTSPYLPRGMSLVRTVSRSAKCKCKC